MAIFTGKALPLLGCMALVLAACGSCSSDESTTAVRPATPATDTAPAADTGTALPDGDVVAEGGDKSYTFKVIASRESTAGKVAPVAVEVVPKTGWKMNEDFPTKLEITAPATAKVDGKEQTKDDAAAFELHRALWKAQVTPAAAGKKELSVELRFAVCTATTCVPKREQVTWAMTVH
ncbi:MAG TPA: hypothetical protein VFG83_14160 [Kofleriaceae bacterium]|nr:hypothetical protein [Kofleriaceae bacterium]